MALGHQAIGESHGLAAPPIQSTRHAVLVFHAQDCSLQQRREGIGNALLRQFVATAQHPFGFEQDQQRDQDVSALGLLGGKQVLGLARLRGIVCHQQSDQDLGVECQHASAPQRFERL